MAGVLRSEIIAKARRRANMENSTFISPAEAVEECDASAQALMDMLREAFGQAYATREQSFTTVPGTKLYSLSTLFLSLLGVYIRTSSTPGVVPLNPFEEREVAELLSLGIMGYAQPENTRYRLTGDLGIPGLVGTAPVNKIELLPVPTVAFTVTYRFIPILNVDADPTHDNYYDGVNGWEEWIAWDLARKWLKKEESDWSGAAEECARVESRIRSLGGQRDQGMPAVVTDTRGGIRDLARLRMGGGRRRWGRP